MNYKERYQRLRKFAKSFPFSIDDIRPGGASLAFGNISNAAEIAPSLVDVSEWENATIEEAAPDKLPSYRCCVTLKPHEGRIGYRRDNGDFPPIEALLLFDDYKPSYSIDTILADYIMDVFGIEDGKGKTEKAGSVRDNLVRRIKNRFELYSFIAVCASTIKNAGEELPDNGKDLTREWGRLATNAIKRWGQNFAASSKRNLDLNIDKAVEEGADETKIREAVSSIDPDTIILEPSDKRLSEINAKFIADYGEKAGNTAFVLLLYQAIKTAVSDFELVLSNVVRFEIKQFSNRKSNRSLNSAYQSLHPTGGAEETGKKPKAEAESAPKRPPVERGEGDRSPSNSLALKVNYRIMAIFSPAKGEAIERVKIYRLQRGLEQEIAALEEADRKEEAELKRRGEPANSIGKNAGAIEEKRGQLNALNGKYGEANEAGKGKYAPDGFFVDGAKVYYFYDYDNAPDLQIRQIEPSMTELTLRGKNSETEIKVKGANAAWINNTSECQLLVHIFLKRALMAGSCEYTITRDELFEEFYPNALRNASETTKGNFWNKTIKTACKNIGLFSMAITFDPTKGEKRHGKKPKRTGYAGGGWISFLWDNRPVMKVTINRDIFDLVIGENPRSILYTDNSIYPTSESDPQLTPTENLADRYIKQLDQISGQIGQIHTISAEAMKNNVPGLADTAKHEGKNPKRQTQGFNAVADKLANLAAYAVMKFDEIEREFQVQTRVKGDGDKPKDD